jgi:predicted SPOUT superfamily RNA methylase MTH1
MFCLMVEASDHGYVLHTRRIHVTRYNVVRVCHIFFFERVTMYNKAKRTRGKLQRFISTVLQFPATRYASS